MNGYKPGDKVIVKDYGRERPATVANIGKFGGTIFVRYDDVLSRGQYAKHAESVRRALKLEL